MASYRTGFVNVENGATSVTGVATLWLSNVSEGDVFVARGHDVSYVVSSVEDDDEIVLSSPWQGNTENNVVYTIVRDFSPNRDYPLVNKGDVETAAVLKRTILKIDEDQSAQLYLVDEDDNSYTFEAGSVL